MRCFAIGVPNNPYALSSVRRSGVDSTHHDRPCGVACLCQVSEHPVCAESSKPRNILKDAPSRSCLNDNSERFGPEAGSSARKARSLSGGGHVLTGKAGSDESDSSKSSKLSCIERPHVIEDRNIRPVLAQYRLRILLDLAERDRLPAHPPRGEREAADAGKEVEVSHSQPPDQRGDPGGRHPEVYAGGQDPVTARTLPAA
jgi:hypothetical protein